MAVEVLRPQDPLRNGYHSSHPSPFHRRRNSPAAGEGPPNPSVNQKKHCSTSQKKADSRPFNASPNHEKKRIKKSPKSPPQISGGGATVASPPMTGQVTILKRGEPLTSIFTSSRSENPNTKLNPNPNFNSNQTLIGLSKIKVADVYAGSGFVISPSPRSLPLPSFFGRKESSDDASETLKRLLRL